MYCQYVQHLGVYRLARTPHPFCFGFQPTDSLPLPLKFKPLLGQIALYATTVAYLLFLGPLSTNRLV